MRKPDRRGPFSRPAGAWFSISCNTVSLTALTTSTPSLEDRLVGQTRRRIRALAAEVARLAQQQQSPRDFYRAFLPRVVSALAAMGGAIWTRGEDGALELQFQIGLQQTGLVETPEATARHGELLAGVLAGGEGSLIAPGADAAEDGPVNPSNYLLVLGPLNDEQDALGVVEIFQRPGADRDTQQGYLKFLLQMCRQAGGFFKTRSLSGLQDRQHFWRRAQEFASVVHESLDVGETAFALANEGRRLIGCERVSVTVLRRGVHQV